LLARAKELGCHEQLAAKLALVTMRLKGKRLPQIVPLGVILIARRPCDVIGQDSPLEICPYVVELTKCRRTIMRGTALSRGPP
jgi:hypothetical protein